MSDRNTLTQTDKFIVKDGFGDENRLHVEVIGLGVVTLNKTHEGLIIDVHSNGNDESIGSLALENGDFAEHYISQVNELIKSFDKNVETSFVFPECARDDGLNPVKAVESFFSDCCFNVSTLTGIKGELCRFNTTTRSLERPYIKISKNTFNSLKDGEYDYYRTNAGKVVTFGYADGGYALMPLNEATAAKVLTNQ